MSNSSATSPACCFLQGHNAWTLGLAPEKINCFLTVSFSALNHTRALMLFLDLHQSWKWCGLCVPRKQCEHLNYFLWVWAAFAFKASVTSTQIVLTCHSFGFDCKTICNLQNNLWRLWCLHMLWLYWGALDCRWLWYCSSQSSEHHWRHCLHTAFILLERQWNTRSVVIMKSVSGVLAMPCWCPKDLCRAKLKFVPPEQVKDAA